MAIVPELYIKATVPIGKENNGKTKWFGTGFLAKKIINEKGEALPFLITNKHVVKDEKCINIRLRNKKDNGFKDVPATLVDTNGDKIYFEHPNSKADIDIVVIPLNAQYIMENLIDFPAFDIDKHMMTSEELRNAGVDEGSLIHMLGFPMGLVNQDSTLPICRLGCVARISKEQIAENHNILVDMQNFPGNSGSPIVTRPEITSIKGTKNLNKSVLLGIIHSYIPYRETLMNTQTKEIVEIKSENSGIALVHPVELIREVVDIAIAKFNKK